MRCNRAGFTDKFVVEIAARYQKACESGLPFPWNPSAPLCEEEIMRPLGVNAVTDNKQIIIR
jgi:hypothetical protein